MPKKHRDLAGKLAREAGLAAPAVAAAGGGAKDAALLSLARLLKESSKEVLAANRLDLERARREGLPPAFLDRLSLDPSRLAGMAEGARQIAALPNPVGRILDGGLRPNGLRVSRISVPLGVILMIYESRPNVTVDAACLCLKAGNACILRGGREALDTNRELGRLVARALASAGLPERAVQVVDIPDRELIPPLLAESRHIDLVVPRGGKGLVKTVMRHSRIPVLKHLDGVCHTYVDASADPELAERVVLNAKTHRPSTCNATETLLVHRDAAPAFLPRCLAALAGAGVEVRADAEAAGIAKKAGVAVRRAVGKDWRTEYNDLIISVGVVPDLSAAIRHINKFGSRHTDAIITSSLEAARRFQLEVDSSSVMVNASTRLADGFEYGLGAEIGISTDKLHARGPVGLEGLTTYKWLIDGDGQVRR
ncbi:MAG: glutamate-5-semialdehyde dehydrogenase [Planctomycetota bacterium]|jgi:glutamate-5-semialdehyde dehydrogenase|nr:glutamate-5-semialdehyde dehydrogenase [Planctomycetota bacterium]